MKEVKMMTAEFLNEIEQEIKHRLRLENGYRLLHVSLGVIIASCGFLTAAASQTETKTTLISSPTSLLIFGLLSAICAIINQIMSPGEVYTHHQNVRRALAYIRGEVKFRKMTVKNAQALRTLALTNTELVWNRLQDAGKNS
jgi:hypothetical protein